MFIAKWLLLDILKRVEELEKQVADLSASPPAGEEVTMTLMAGKKSLGTFRIEKLRGQMEYEG